jgi:maltose alpha-D-glucosyltransferase/alpha-amylase
MAGRKPRGRSGADGVPLSTGFPADPQWYKDAVIYQVAVRAFRDASGDGIGDFRGLTSKLDYLADLGVTAIWVMPFYPSPLRDDGYDIADYLRVHPDYGSLRDVRRFIREAHKRELRVITELVINHTSDQHPWFQRARKAAPGSPERDWYVWSDTTERYEDVRIIFKDFETSNWTWDETAGAYFWHRFYSHQPDLNFDSPEMREALLRIVDFWLEAGVDGLRLDAIPYLYEREGTGSENLPETHAFLKSLRGYIDRHYADRMLLAEANQWPEDSVAYFGDGDGDECHMAFHFPLMPRMFMALRMEDRYPIIDILEQTPELPANGQWALFLRNHDELTLEMVTDEERDYMYRVYADDPQARINLGIRRRLAPLLSNNRRRIELLYGLLLSMPGTPVIYYGDEIGMGDNVYLGDRNGVRTPMQWSSDRNAGFSSANRQRLYQPLVTDPEYHYEAVNVEAQQANPQSLLWWMKRIIALRKRHPAFGRGSLRFLHPENRRILAFVREYEDETILVVANLSRYTQWTELPLADYEGRVPREIFGSVEFPRVGNEPYMMMLGPHAFEWFRLEADTMTEAFASAGDRDLPELRWTGDLEELARRHSRRLANVLLEWMLERRWYRGKARKVIGARLTGSIPVRTSSSTCLLALLEVEYADGEPELYALPLVSDLELDLEELLATAPWASIARLVGGDTPAQLIDGALVPEVLEALMGIAAGRRRVRGAAGMDLLGHAFRGLRNWAGTRAQDLPATPMSVEQSNSSALFGERLIMKLYRAIEAGPNPDLEVCRFLVDRGFKQVPPVLGSIDLDRGAKPGGTVAMIQAFVPNEGDLWKATRLAVESFLQDAVAEPELPTLGSEGASGLLALSRTPPPEVAYRLIGGYLETARVLGQRIGEMHTVLASADPSEADFVPEAMAPFHVRALYQSIRSGVRESLSLLRARQGLLSEPDRAISERILEASGEVDGLARGLLDRRIGGQRIRIHGDLHLGQVLDTGGDVMIIDFEGEPARPLGERRLKRPALTDLAGMIRSFHYAAHGSRIERPPASEEDEASERAATWARFWYQSVAAACIRGYREVTEGAPFLPGDDDAWCQLLDALMLAKLAYELRYELGSRPTWVGIPLSGLLEITGITDRGSDSTG